MKRWIHAKADSNNYNIAELVELASKTPMFDMPEEFHDFLDELENNPELCEETLSIYFDNKPNRHHDPLDRIFQAIARNSQLSVKCLKEMAEDNTISQSVSYLICKHPNLDDDILQSLLNNGKEYDVARVDEISEDIASQIIDSGNIHAIIELGLNNSKYVEDAIDAIKECDSHYLETLSDKVYDLMQKYPEYKKELKPYYIVEATTNLRRRSTNMKKFVIKASTAAKNAAKRRVTASNENKYTEAFFNEEHEREDELLDWISEDWYEENEIDLTNKEDYDRAIEYAEEIAEDNGWAAFNTINEEFEALWDWNNGDVEDVLRGFEYGYGNGERLFPLDYENGGPEAFYAWVKLYHPEVDLSGIEI